jgi:hypothetical protein
MSASSLPPSDGSSYAERLREALKTRCVNLKTKSSYLGLPGPADEEGRHDTAIWWCERTCQALGPDGLGAHPSRCEAPSRSCYEPPRRPRA